MASNSVLISDDQLTPSVRGFLHSPEAPNGDGLVLTHGAGGNCNAPLLVALSDAFARAGFIVLRCDLPYRQDRNVGPPSPMNAERDRAGLRNAVVVLRQRATGKVFLGGHSYGGRQASMLCAEEPDIAAGLLLLSYPLHPPRKPDQLRVQHFSKLRTPCLFVHGTRDPFATSDELQSSLQLIPARSDLLQVDGAGHDLGFKAKIPNQLPERIVAAFREMFQARLR